MDYSVSESLQNRLNITQQFLEAEVFKNEKHLLSSNWVMLEQFISEARLKAKSMKLWAPHLPENIGGCYSGLVDLALIAEVLGQSPLGKFLVSI